MTIATFLFDPLCGWCYGATPVLERMGGDGFGLDLLPLGLPGQRRPIDPEFAGLIWATDRRVADQTGQPFTRAYRSLLDGGAAELDPWPATLGLIAVARTRPDRQLPALEALQIARFVNGRDTSERPVVETVLREIGLRHAADLLAAADPVLIAAAEAAVRHGQALMARHGVDDGPCVLLAGEEGERLLNAQILIARAAAQRPVPARPAAPAEERAPRRFAEALALA